MGCFNKTGFFSHLPITYGDEIVMFVCADSYSRSCTRDNTPISIVGTGMTPIAPHFSVNTMTMEQLRMWLMMPTTNFSQKLLE